jgi:hypothetical protein
MPGDDAVLAERSARRLTPHSHGFACLYAVARARNAPNVCARNVAGERVYDGSLCRD